MERRDPTGEHKVGLQATSKLPKRHHRHEPHPRPKDPHRRDHKDSSRTEARPDPTSAKLPKESRGAALSGDDDYVRRWLARTESDTNQDDALVTRGSTSKPHKGRVAHAEYGSRRTPLDLADVPKSSKRKKRHDSSSDSSLLEVPIRPHTHQPKRQETKSLFPKQPEVQSAPLRKRQRVASSDSGLTSRSPIPNPPLRDTFEKRQRHKTRQDKYDPKKEKKQKNAGEEQPNRKKREKTGDRKKVAKKAGEDLIQNFSSKSIAQDRLTIRPSHGLGLFNNGRASSPARLRGLPDLAFSEMDFLQYSRAHQHNDQENVVKSRSREKEKKKATQRQDEISSFFRPTRAPLQDVSSNGGGPSSEVGRKELNVYAKQLEFEQDARDHRNSEAIDLRNEPKRQLEAAEPLSRGHHAGHSYHASPVFDGSIIPPCSGKATTYVSWSESHRSPVPTPLRGDFDHRHVSHTPDSVRRSIEKTGIFRDTGIGKALGFDRMSASPGTYRRNNPRASDLRCNNMSDPTSTEMTRSSEGGVVLFEDSLQDRQTAYPTVSRHVMRDELPELPEKLADTVDLVNQHGTSRKRIVIEHFDPALGWREDSNAVDPDQQTSVAAIRPKATPLNRDKIAQKARIKIPKRPSTTVPFVRETRKEAPLLLQEGHDTIISALKPRSEPQTGEDVPQASSSRMLAHSDQNSLLPIASNPNLPTVYEDAYEQSPRDSEALLHKTQQGLENPTELSQPRLTSTWNNNQIREESQLQQQNASYYSAQEIFQMDAPGSREGLYFNSQTSGTWLGRFIGDTRTAPSRLPSIDVGQSLYVRQMQPQTTFEQLEYDGSHSAVGEPSWTPSLVGPLAYGYQHQQYIEDLAEESHPVDRHDEPASYQARERRLDDMNGEQYELGIWRPEAHDTGSHDTQEGQDYEYSEHDYLHEQNCPQFHGQSYQIIDYGGHGVQENMIHGRFWQSQYRF